MAGGKTSEGSRGPALVAGGAAALMIAQQVGGKAVRDALFLSEYPARELPKVMIASAVLSVLAVLAMSRVMARVGPGRAVPAVFGVSGLLFAGEWVLVETAPAIAAWVVYLHMAVFGATVISGFWSVVNERFDPHTAKRVVARITAAATFGGLVGGLAAERVAVWFDLRAMLPVLAVLNLLCSVAMVRVGAPLKRPSDAEADGVSGFAILKEAPYLQKLGGLVGLVAITAALLDYALKAQASVRLESSETLMQFFALFYTAVGLATFLLQTLLARTALSKLGLDGTIALLPGAVMLTATLGAAFTRMWTVVVSRGIEMVLANSLYRSGYELLYTPLSPAQKRPTKTIIDVAFDRAGDAVGSGLVLLVLAFAGDGSVSAVLAVAAATALGALLLSRTLQRGYVQALAESLRSGAVRIEEGQVLDATTRRTLSETTHALDRERLLREIEELRRERAAESLTPSVPPDPKVEPAAPDPLANHEPLLAQAKALLSRDPERVRPVLGEGPDPRLVSLVIPLLADRTLHDSAIRALRKLAPRVTGELTDALVDQGQPFAVRRRLPRVLRGCDTQRAALGLLEGLSDPRFEVRFQCGQAISGILLRNPSLTVPADAVLEAARRELEGGEAMWETGALLEEEDERSPWLDHVLRRRLHRRLEHVFTVLSLALDHETLLLSLRALYSDDPSLRGTALEYLENVLPEDIRDRLWPYLEHGRPSKRTPRSREEIVQELFKSVDSLQIDRSSLRDPEG